MPTTNVNGNQTTVTENQSNYGYDAASTATAATGDLSITTDELEISASASASNGGGTNSSNIATAHSLKDANLWHSGTKTNLRATAYGHTSNAYGSLNSQIHLTNEEGANLQIRSTSTTRGLDPAFGLSSSTVETSDGNDTISIKAKSQNDRAGNGTISLESTGLKNSFLNTGGGDDTIKINAENQYNHYYGHYLASSNTLGLSGGNINAGTGDDQITITAKGGLINTAISSSSVK